MIYNCPLTNATISTDQIKADTVSDNYHTMDELYDHRSILFAFICSQNTDISWKSKCHSDGSSEEGWFIAGLETPHGQITYHQKIDFWGSFLCKELDKAPEYDGHTPDDVFNRFIMNIIDMDNTES